MVCNCNEYIVADLQSPEGGTVATAAGGVDETLMLWNVFASSKAAQQATEPFANFNRIR